MSVLGVLAWLGEGATLTGLLNPAALGTLALLIHRRSLVAPV